MATLKETMLDVLSKAKRNINFNLNGLIVTGQRYAKVAEFIRSGHITFEVLSQIPLQPGQVLPPGTRIGARYVPADNKMLFTRADYGSSGTDDGHERGVMLHEATHALLDVFARSGNDQVLAIDDESAATLAEALYLKYCQNDGSALHRFVRTIGGRGDLALKLADAIMKANAGEQRYDLQPQQMVGFRNRVAVEWGLVKRGDTDSSGAVSTYNGVTVCLACWGRRTCLSGFGAGASLSGGGAALGDQLAGPKFIKVRPL